MPLISELARPSAAAPGLAFAFALAFAAVAADARAEDTRACVGAAGRGQDLRAQGKLTEARAAFLSCASPTCPRVVRNDCTRWVAEVEASLPTVVFAAADRGQDVTDVSVAIDGVAQLSALDGKAVAVDPGPHVLRFVRGAVVREERVVVAEGEKNRKIVVVFDAATGSAPLPGPAASGAAVPAPGPALVTTPAAPPPTAAPPAPAPALVSPLPRTSSAADEPARTAHRAPPVVAYALAGLGVAALGSFTYFGLSGKGDYRSLRDSCSPACTDGQIGKVHDELLAADVSLGVAVVSLGVAAYLFLATR